ncbi:UNVERIFIED_CONTAM: hypothetical protein GTU68_044673 [Idotea baltica]|nr:hypothetical protein [Idotea baltica]
MLVTAPILDFLRRLRLPPQLKEFLAFGYKQARACIFAGSFFGLLFISTKVDVPGLARYDLILIGALLIQFVLVATRVESLDELKMIMLYHVLGFTLEAFKTHPDIGSWSYPEDGLTKLGTVPLYSGFMYSAIGSYMSQSWRLLDLRLTGYPPKWLTVLVSAAIYVNFFTNAFVADIRWYLFVAVFLIFMRSRVYFTPLDRTYWMPVWLSFVLIAFFVWVAENISTFFDAWQYPDQALGWKVVDFQKITSWSLLVIISFVLIVDLKHLKYTKR